MMDKNLMGKLLDSLSDNKKEGAALKNWLEINLDKTKSKLVEELDATLQGEARAYEKLLKRLSPKKQEKIDKIKDQYL